MKTETNQIYVNRLGEGAPVLLIHGFLANGGMWQPLLPDLKNRSFIIPDLPGHGQSAPLTSPFTMETVADLCAELVLESKHDRVDVVGHSMGGYIACALLERHPELVRSLCLFHSSARCDDNNKKKARVKAIEAAKMHKTLYLKTILASLFSKPFQAERFDKIEELINEADQMSTEAIVQALKGMKVRAERTDVLTANEVPIAYILGDVDTRLPIDEMKKELALTRPQQHLVIEGCGHMSHIEAPQEAGLFLKAWLNS